MARAVDRCGTPCLVFAEEPLASQGRALETAFSELPRPVEHWWSFKTLPLLPAIRWWHRRRPGAGGRGGVEVVSEFELQAALAGFAAFRNYDGAGAAFGDTSVRATSSDNAAVSVYASTDTLVAGRVVIVVINRSVQTVPVVLNVQSASSFSSAEVRSLSGASPAFVASGALNATGPNASTEWMALA